jgi:hypothetical protein
MLFYYADRDMQTAFGGVVIARVWALVTGDDDPGLERLDLLDARDPPHSLVVVGLCEPPVDAVVGHVAGDHRIQARDADNRRGVSARRWACTGDEYVEA